MHGRHSRLRIKKSDCILLLIPGVAFGVLKIYETKRTFLLLSMEEKHHEFTESTGCAGVNLVGFISETKQLWRSD